MSRLALIVDPHQQYASVLAAAAREASWSAHVAEGFDDARRQLGDPDLAAVITSIKLGSFNGIHLVYLATQIRSDMLCITHGDDPGLAADAQRAGAFYERRDFAPFALARYLSAGALPARDRRDPTCIDRRMTFRGGRRRTDVPMLRRLPEPVSQPPLRRRHR